MTQRRLGDFRVGTGYDIHRLEKGLPLRLCGVTVESDFGAVGHSDADAALHALCDAILGALSLGDIGTLFPDDDPQYKDMDSRRLLEEVVRRMEEAGFLVENADVTIVLEQPKLRQYVEAMRTEVAKILQVDEESVGVKAKTKEGLGPEGRGEAVSCQAVVLLRNRGYMQSWGSLGGLSDLFY